jgi:hypothetical protein
MGRATAQEREYARTLWGRDYGCAVCGLEYVAQSEEDRRIHRSRHREVLQVFVGRTDVSERTRAFARRALSEAVGGAE